MRTLTKIALWIVTPRRAAEFNAAALILRAGNVVLADRINAHRAHRAS